MVKAISALAAAVFVAAAVAILLGLSPSVEASTPAPVVKSSRLANADCEPSGWPYYRPDCLRDQSRNAGRATPVRLVTTDRLPDARPTVDPEWHNSLASLQVALPGWARAVQ